MVLNGSDGAQVDAARWPKVGGTNAGGYYEVERDILVAVPTPGYVQTTQGARASLGEMNRIARERGRRLGLIVLVDRVRSQDGASRRIWQREMDPSLICGLGLVGGTLLGRAIGSFFVGIYRPAVETKLVDDFASALEWIRGRVQEHGGPIEP